MRRFADPPGGASPPPLRPPGEYRALGPNLGMDFSSAVLRRCREPSGETMAEAIGVRAARLADVEALARFNRGLAEETEGIRLDERTVEEGVRAVLRDPSK